VRRWGHRSPDVAQYRFNRTERSLAEFDEASLALQTTPGISWIRAPFATRLLGGGLDRVTLLENRIKFRRNGEWTQEAIAPEDWKPLLARWFAMAP